LNYIKFNDILLSIKGKKYFMTMIKKSLEWLNPLDLNAKEVERFQRSLEKPISREDLQRQKNIFRVAQRIKRNERND
jgi:hypothetical protein